MISKEKVIEYRKLKGLTQNDLSLESGLSLRTIQRIEKGISEGSPHTLKSLASVLEISSQDLLLKEGTTAEYSQEDTHKLKLINLSALSVILLPLGNLLLPIVFFLKYRSNNLVNKKGRKIISFQVIWTLTSIFMLIVSPFFRHLLNEFSEKEYFTANKMPILMYIVLVTLNIILTIKTASEINENKNILRFIPNIL